MNGMGMNMGGMDMMNGMGMMDNTKALDPNGLKNLANLYSMNIIKK